MSWELALHTVSNADAWRGQPFLPIFTRDLGASVIRILAAFEQEGVRFDKHWEACVKGLKLIAGQAAEFGVTLAVQNQHNVSAHHNILRWMLEEVGYQGWVAH